MSLPVRMRVKERRQEEQKLEALTEGDLMSALLGPNISDVTVKTVLKERKLPSVIWQIRQALMKGPAAWERPIERCSDGDLLLWSKGHFRLEDPKSCLALPGWTGNLETLLQGDSDWKRKRVRRTDDSDYFEADSGSSLANPFKRLRAKLSVGAAKRSSGVVKRLTVEAIISTGWGGADYRHQLKDFGEIAIFCADIQRRLNIMPSFMLDSLRQRTFRIYQTMVLPHLETERSALFRELAKHAIRFICRDLHPTLVDFLLPKQWDFYPAPSVVLFD